jgi:DNA invertase Pin-like site-specific DNA recombinase
MAMCAAKPAGGPGQRVAFVGYARVSTDEQNLDFQIDALKAAGCRRVFCDEGVSGAAPSRPALQKALAALRPGDVLVTWKLDRLGRSLAHLIEIIGTLERKDVGFRSLSEAIDTTTAGGMLIFHVMGALAEFERALIAERTKAGMAAARARGRRLGRPQKLSQEQIAEVRCAKATGQQSVGDLARRFAVSKSTIHRALK